MVRKMLKYFAELINRRMLLDKSAITYEQFPLLIITIHCEGCSMQEIARITHQDKAGILRGLRSLEMRGFITFKNDPDDLRKRLVFSTQKARDLSIKIMNEVKALEKELFHGIPADEMSAFFSVIKKVTDKCLELGATKFQRNSLKSNR
ncbi:MAG: MarR family winged helix-turn-helix transcriptional regulator [Chitinispirillaceae bacterium]